jgi:hypothetical protein
MLRLAAPPPGLAPRSASSSAKRCSTRSVARRLGVRWRVSRPAHSRTFVGSKFVAHPIPQRLASGITLIADDEVPWGKPLLSIHENILLAVVADPMSISRNLGRLGESRAVGPREMTIEVSRGEELAARTPLRGVRRSVSAAPNVWSVADCAFGGSPREEHLAGRIRWVSAGASNQSTGR